MKKKKFTLKTKTDIKVFLLFLLEYINYPIERTTLINIIADNAEELTIDYDECLGELTDTEHVWFDEVDGETYYMISDTGRMVATELFDSLDKEFREKSLKIAIKHLSLSSRGAVSKVTVTELQNGRFKVNLKITESIGDLLDTSIVVSSRSEAERIRKNFEERPDSVYRGMLLSATGRIEYIC